MENTIPTALAEPTAENGNVGHAGHFRLCITHPGVFHADEVCAIAYLRLNGFRGAVERRVPTPEELANPKVLVIDIGGEHDPANGNFDHHQKGGAGARWTTEVPFAAFGLVYDWISPIDGDVEYRFGKAVVEPVDAADCGWGTCEGTRPLLSFSACISSFNPGPGANPIERNDAFERAVQFATQVISNMMASAEEWAAARSVVMTAPTADCGRVLVLETFVPWAEHVFDRADQGRLLYTAFPSERGGWCLQQIPSEPGSFEGRAPLPEAWAGLRGEAFASAAGLGRHGDATFCHPGRFICGAETKDDVIALATKAIDCATGKL
jgi:uncharacterized UPF0160 family protein